MSMMVGHSRYGSKDHCCGIEVTNNLNWEHWEPGGEYTQKLILKNVNVKTKKLKYRIPNTQFFTTRYPQPITLSSGTSISLPITFKPLVKDRYEEFIEFLTKDGKFKIAMKASLPEAQLKLPDSINFGMCAVKDQMTVKFEITNISNLHVKFHLKSDDIFVLSPTGGTLAPKTHAQINATFKPQGAYVYEVDAVCLFGNDMDNNTPKKIKLEGIGKYPHLAIRYDNQKGHDILIKCGDIGVGSICEKTVEIKNLIPVNAPFQILQKSQGISVDNVFKCSQYHGVVPANNIIKVKFIFQPEIVNTSYVEHFEIYTVGLSSKTTIKCVGNGIGPELDLEVKSINFGVTKQDVAVTRSFKIKNLSKIPAVYQFQSDRDSSVFQLNCLSGLIDGESSQTIIVNFIPTKPIVYYKQMVCLVHNQGPLAIDLFGSCCTNQIKPVMLTAEHIDRHSVHVKRGISRLSPDHIMALVKENKIIFDDDDNLKVVDEDLDKTMEKSEKRLSSFEEYFNDGSLNEESMMIPHISTDVQTIDFGQCQQHNAIQKTVSLTNHTHGKVTCHWMNFEKSFFTVIPEESDINALSTMSFRIVFRPNAPSQFYCSELEAFVYYKCMREHQLVDEKMITPPWLVNVKVSAHTFPKQSETFLPLAKWDSTNIIFPPVTQSLDSAYRTCLVKNTGENSIHFSFAENTIPEFTCKPSMSLLQKHNYQVFVLRMNPLNAMGVKAKTKCVMNYSAKYTEDIELNLTVESPQVALTPNDFVYFKPTCIGSLSVQKTMVKNISRLPLRLQWKLATCDENVLKVEPSVITILPNEIQKHIWSFIPVIKTQHLFKVKLLATVEGNDLLYHKYELRLLGSGQSGQISCDHSSIDFGDIIVGNDNEQTVTLWNDSDCCLKYRLKIQHKLTTLQLDTHTKKNDQSILSLDHYEFLLPSRSNKKLIIKVKPNERAYYQCTVSYELVSIDNQELNNTADEHIIGKRLCDVTVQGVYPSLILNDIQGGGCVEHYSKKTLQELFHVKNFNRLLDNDPDPSELRYSMTSRHSTRRRMPDTTSALNYFDFGTSIYGSEPCVISVSFYNNTGSTTEWSLKYPSDLQLELDYWADTGELEPDELHEMFVMDCELFHIQPMKGMIKAGQSQTVIFTYKHALLGIHQIPLLFKIKQGREIKIFLLGHTVDPDVSALHFISKTHEFDPVSIGNTMPPVQHYPLYNGSNQPVRFTFDLSVLDHIQKENYDWRVIECLTPIGEIPPFQHVDTQWLFAPLELKCYQISIPLHIENGDIASILISGTGYDPQVMEAKLYEDDNVLLNQCRNNDRQNLLQVSTESISFGHIPLFCETSEMIFLKNLSCNDNISYRFHLEDSMAGGVVNIHPSGGLLKPNEIKVCKVKIFSEGPPAIYKFNIICEVINETLLERYKMKLIKWEKREDEKKHLFTIRDVYDQPCIERSVSANTKKLKAIPSNTVSRSDSDLRKYEALPPIKVKASKPTKILIEEKPVLNNENKPVPPRSILHHLAINLETHTVNDYQELSPEKWNQCFVQRAPLRDISTSSVACNKDVLKEEIHFIENVLTFLMKDVVDDDGFISPIKLLKDEALPYFSMFTSNTTLMDEKLSQDERLSSISFVVSDTSVKSDEKLTFQNNNDDVIMRGVNFEDQGNHVESQQNLSSVGEKASKHDDSSRVSSQGVMRDNFFKENVEDDLVQKRLDERQELKKNDEFRYMLHDVIENSIFNLLNEANFNEISLTNRPRLVALPPNNKH